MGGAVGVPILLPSSDLQRLKLAATLSAPGSDPTNDRALHVLNRLTWGVRPKDIETILKCGIDGYIAWQLIPETIPDPDLEKRLKPELPLQMSRVQLANFIATDSNNEDNISHALVHGRIMRAVHSERQLYERVVEFWSDHFNIPLREAALIRFIDDQDVIRKHALGKFRDLLLASSQSVAMLRYLNNDTNSKEVPNENYAREVMELHTLGVDGGYTEKDVKAAARALTGWRTTENKVPQFRFDLDAHDKEAKTVLGVTLPAGRGIEDGLELLDMLATHPETARFIATKLAKRFVSETPSPALVDGTAAVFMQTEGDIRKVLTYLLLSTEFMASKGKKFRRPLEYIVAALRLTGAQVASFDALLDSLSEMGHAPFGWGTPDGYPDTARKWLNSSGMLARWKVAQAICSPNAAEDFGLTTALDKLIPLVTNPDALVREASRITHPAGLPDADYASILALAQGDAPLGLDNFAERRGVVVAALLASPAFQWQ